jgi:hypothetical protein
VLGAAEASEEASAFSLTLVLKLVSDLAVSTVSLSGFTPTFTTTTA